MQAAGGASDRSGVEPSAPRPPADGYEFAVCLSHDVDRVHKSFQYLYEALVDRRPSAALGLLSPRNPWWQFPRIMAIEAAYGVRSSFHFLIEQSLRDRPRHEWLTPRGWRLFAGGYDVADPQLTATIALLDRFGWEVGLHGSYESAEDAHRLGEEKATLEAVLGGAVRGNRQHYLNLARPATWEHLRDLGIGYDLSLADAEGVGFQEGYELIRPFDDAFVVFPWTVMDMTLAGWDDRDAAWERGRALLAEAKRHRSVLVLDWHQRVFHAPDFPGWDGLYRRLIHQAIEMGAWVGAPGTFYRALEHPDGTVEQALDALADPVLEEPLEVSTVTDPEVAR